MSSSWPSAAGSGAQVTPPLIGVLALQGDFEAHGRVLERLGARRARGARAGRPRRARRAGDPGRRVDDDDARRRARGPRRAAARARRRGRSRARLVRGADHARPRASRADGHARRAQRVRPPGQELRGRRRARRPRRRRRCTACSSARPWIAEHGPGVEILGEVDGHPVAARQGEVLAVAFHTELGEDDRLHRLFLQQVDARRG